MKYALLLFGDETGYATLSEQESKELYARHEAFRAELGEAILSGAELRESATATTIRRRDGEVLVTDGPFAEAAEQLGGLYLVEADDIDQAIDYARRVPALSTDVVEVRPLQG